MKKIAALLIAFVTGCSSMTPEEQGRERSLALEKEIAILELRFLNNKLEKRKLIIDLETRLPELFPGTVYFNCFNGMDSTMVQSMLGDLGGIVWAQGVPLPLIFENFMKRRHPPDGLPKFGLAVQDNVVVGTVVKLTPSEE